MRGRTLENYRFDKAEVRPAERALLIDGVRAELGSRAFDVLYALIKNRGRVVTKDESLDLVWPGLVVQENNLQAQVSTLRKLLGPKAIATIPARGYQFSLTETVLTEIPNGVVPSDVPSHANLSPQLSRQCNPEAVMVQDPPSALTQAERAAVFGDIANYAVSNTPALSIAVLPFANLTGDANDEYFSDGLADELLNVLAKIKGLRVIARTSSFSFKGQNVDIPAIGARLGVAHVVDGSVRKSGDRLRISVQLVKVADSSPIWSEVYDRTLDDIFAVQDDIAQCVLTELRTKFMRPWHGEIERRMVKREVAAATKGRSANSTAHNLYLQARFLLNRRAAADIAKSVKLLRQALAIDPHSAQTWATFSQALVAAVDYAVVPQVEGTAEALAAVQRALALQPDLVDGHIAMCTYQKLRAWDWQIAISSVQRALHLSPDEIDAQTEAAQLYFLLGRLQESLEYASRATMLDPVNAISYRILGSTLGALGRWAASEAAFRQAIEFAPDRPGLRASLAFVLERQGRQDEALDAVSCEPADFLRWRTLSCLHFRGGNLVDSDRNLHALIDRYGDLAAFNIAAAYGAHGDADHAFEWLERAYAVRDSGLSYVKCHGMLQPIQADPRWPVFLRKMGFEEYDSGIGP